VKTGVFCFSRVNFQAPTLDYSLWITVEFRRVPCSRLCVSMRIYDESACPPKAVGMAHKIFDTPIARLSKLCVIRCTRLSGRLQWRRVGRVFESHQICHASRIGGTRKASAHPTYCFFTACKSRKLRITVSSCLSQRWSPFKMYVAFSSKKYVRVAFVPRSLSRTI